MSVIQSSHQTRRGPKGDTATRVPYAVLQDIYSEDYRGSDGTEISFTALVPWSQRDNFVKAVMPDVAFVPDDLGGLWRLNRYLPEYHPEKNWLYCVNAKVVRPIGAPKTPTTPAEQEMFQWIQYNGDDAGAEVQVTFRELPYFADKTDAQVLADPERELIRYVSRKAKPTGEAIQVGGPAFYWSLDPAVGGLVQQLGNEGAARVLPTGDLTYTCHFWPVGAIPHAVLGQTQSFPSLAGNDDVNGFLGRCNGTNFDNTGFALAADQYVPGTLVYLSCEFGDLYYSPTGLEVVDFTLTMQYRPDRWYKIWRRSVNQFREVTRTELDASIVGATGVGQGQFSNLDANGNPKYHPATGRSRHMFDYASFYSLFRPGPANTIDPGAST